MRSLFRGGVGELRGRGRAAKGLLGTLLTLGVVLALCPIAGAQWVTAASGGVAGGAASVRPDGAPTPAVSGRTVSLSWPAGVLSNGTAVPGYILKRYDSNGTNGQTITSGSCAAPIAGTSCSETNLPTGTWRYSITPAIGNWRGAESDTVSVVVGSPSLSVPNQFTPVPATLSGTISTFADGDTITFHLEAPQGAELEGTIAGVATPAAVPAGGSAAMTVELPASLDDGPHAIHAVGENGDSAVYPLTVDSTAPPTPSITSGPAAAAASPNATLHFEDSEPGVTFHCRLDAGGYVPCTSPVSYAALADGPHTFEVRVADRADNRSPLASRTWTVDTSLPTAAISFPVAGGVYGNATFGSACGTPSSGICGSAGDAGTGVASVELSLRNVSGSYYDGTGFSSASEVWLPANGAASWSYALAPTQFPAEGLYAVRVRATDGAGNVGAIASATLTIDRTAPTATDIQVDNGAGGTSGKPESGDSVVYTFSETMLPGSILGGWNGGSTTVTVRLDDEGSSDTLSVFDAGNAVALNLGTVVLGGKYVGDDRVFTGSSMTMSGPVVTITLGTPSGTTTFDKKSYPASWSPSAFATDPAGNPVSVAGVSEGGPDDRNF